MAKRSKKRSFKPTRSKTRTKGRAKGTRQQTLRIVVQQGPAPGPGVMVPGSVGLSRAPVRRGAMF